MEFCVYTSDLESTLRLARAGATAFIIDSPLYSIRAISGPQTAADLQRLVEAIRSELPSDTPVYLQWDAMCHDMDFASQAISEIRELAINGIRVQDYGLAQKIRNELPGMPIHFVAETGNMNLSGLKRLETLGIQRLLLSNELPYPDLVKIKQAINTELELQVQGPILIQYAYRRFLADLLDSKESIYSLAEDEDLPGRQFQFLDQAHGHLMFAHFDRCLIMQIPALSDLALSSWLIDTHFYSLAAAEQILHSYSHAAHAYLEDPEQADSAMDVKMRFTELTGRPQKPGFFIANHSDQDWRDEDSEHKDRVLAKVIDAKKAEYAILSAQTELIRPGRYEMRLPTRKEKEINISEIESISDQGVLLQKIPWQKSLMVGAEICSLDSV